MVCGMQHAAQGQQQQDKLCSHMNDSQVCLTFYDHPLLLLTKVPELTTRTHTETESIKSRKESCFEDIHELNVLYMHRFGPGM